MRRTHRLCLMSMIATVAACHDATGSRPAGANSALRATNDSLALFVAVSPKAIVPGDTATVTVSVTNRTARTVVVGFPDSCQLMYEVVDAAGRPAPDRGGSGCLTVITTLRLDPGASKTAQHKWTAMEWTYPPSAYRPRPPGEYRVYGLLGLFHPLLRSEPVTITVLAR